MSKDGELTFDINSHSEFPSLSSAQAQHPSQAAWGNTTQRVNTHLPSQPLQGPGSGAAPTASSHAMPATSQTQPLHPQQQENIFSASSHFAGNLDEIRFGGSHSVVGQPPRSVQPKTTSIEEFPPLGRSPTGEIGQDRRESLMHGGEPGNLPNGSGPGLASHQSQTVPGRSDVLGAVTGLLDGTRPSGMTAGMMGSIAFDAGAMSAVRSPADTIRQRHVAPGDQERNGSVTSAHNGSQFPSLGSLPQGVAPAEPADSQPLRQSAAMVQNLNRQTHQTQASLDNDVGEPPQVAQAAETLASMSELDRFGLTGLLHMIRSEGSDIGSLAIGQDLTALGLDLNQPDNRPLYHSFASPFAEPTSRPIEPDYYIPSCYTVHNVRPIQEQVTSFSDETLFYIFYSMPRDILQEMAAVELTNRMWRYHKELKLWLTKDAAFEPVRVSASEERGYYIFFDTASWQRQRRELVLRYEDLEGRIVPISGAGSQGS